MADTGILATLQNGVSAIQTVAQKLSTVFPQSTASSSNVPSSAGTLVFSSSQAVGFLLVQTSSGATVKVPFYNQ